LHGNTLQAAGIAPKIAPGIGIAVDHRRRNRCEESLKANTDRLKTYTSKLLVFPRNSRKPKAGEASKEQVEAATQHTGPILPIVKQTPVLQYASITSDMKVRPSLIMTHSLFGLTGLLVRTSCTHPAAKPESVMARKAVVQRISTVADLLQGQKP
jgi:hypothetical protein